MTHSDKESVVFTVGYTISDAAGHYRAAPDYPTWEEAVDHCDRDAGEAVGAVLSDGSVTFEI
ncbi:hypothetical protein [Novispirillum itersonii]|uniref:hypothetical protein n=1 Tax=Novispirillum itersonii TaxID=189 RepID=UPI00035DBBE3|nr:hypothetical protein [Novispirillum itersonii]